MFIFLQSLFKKIWIMTATLSQKSSHSPPPSPSPSLSPLSLPPSPLLCTSVFHSNLLPPSLFSTHTPYSLSTLPLLKSTCITIFSIENNHHNIITSLYTYVLHHITSLYHPTDRTHLQGTCVEQGTVHHYCWQIESFEPLLKCLNT